jgi:hypothetical protein
MLPDDIRVRNLLPAPCAPVLVDGVRHDFHAIASAVGKKYVRTASKIPSANPRFFQGPLPSGPSLGSKGRAPTSPLALGNPSCKGPCKATGPCEAPLSRKWRCPVLVEPGARRDISKSSERLLGHFPSEAPCTGPHTAP